MERELEMINDNKLNIKPISKRKTAKEKVYNQLKSSILTRVIDHKKMFTETMLSESLQTSRTPIREAIADLISEGLIVHIPRMGYKVREVTEKEMDQIIFLRKSIEIHGVITLAKNITESEIKQLYKIVSEQEEVIQNNDNIYFIELDQLFHNQMLEFADLHFLAQIFSELYNLARLMSHEALIKKGRNEDVVVEHRKIVDALKSGNPIKASESMENHLLTTMKIVRNVRKK